MKFLIVLVGVVSTLTTPVRAQYPNCDVRILIPLPAGSSGDVIVRVFAEALTTHIKRAVIPENRPGAFGSITATNLIESKPDGCTLGAITPPMLWPILQGNNITHDPSRFALLSELARYELFLVVAKDSPFNSIADLLRANPYNYSGPHVFGMMAGEQLRRLTTLTALNVGDQRAGERGAVLALLQTQESEKSIVSFAFLYGPTVAGQTHGSGLRAIGVASASRSAFHKEVPTLGELLPTWEPINVNIGLAAPSGVPRYILEQLEKDIAHAMNARTVEKKLSTLWSTANATGSAQYRAFAEESRKMYARFGR